MEAVYPRATEKSYHEQSKRTYIFVVPEGASKQAVAEMVASQYGVSVSDVRILIRKGKATKFSKGKHAYPGKTFRQDKRIAYVTLKAGDSIKIFEEVEEADKTDKKSEKKAEKAEKAAAKKSAKTDQKSEKKGDK